MLRRKDETFRDFVLDQLSGLGKVTARSMFGGYGLYQDNVFFGIIYAGKLYFKTDAAASGPYQERKMKPFNAGAKQILKKCLEVPGEVLDDQDELLVWALDAIRCCLPPS